MPTIINVALDLWFVARLGWGVAGAAIATVTAQSVSAIICAIKVSRYEMFRLQRRHFKLNRILLSEYFSLSIPMLLQSFVIASGGLFVQKHINNYGSNFAAGMSASEKIFIMIETSGIALSPSAAAFVSQNYGAKQFDRIRQGVRSAVIISLCFAVFSSTLLFLFGRQILALFVASDAIKFAWSSLCVT
ncbi:MAG: MATE family efflux transporter, partial [Clostridiaceae bacterium]|nr:MATE family efflux transporter [Clostridiaceae bacterium]